MKQLFKNIILLFFLFLVAMSCKKEDEKCIGGSGGKVTLKVLLQHHNHTLTNLKNYRDTVYVKYNVQEYPGSKPSDYDASYFGEYGQDYVLIPNLRCGNYYIFAVGLEPQHFMRVSGGIPCTIEAVEGEVTKIIPVTE